MKGISIILFFVATAFANPNGCPLYFNSQSGNLCGGQESLAELEKIPSFKLLNFNTCGKVNAVAQKLGRGRIACGSDAKLFEFPWNAQLGFKQSDDTIKFECGGSLISENFVLTAASCLMTKSDKERKVDIVRLGEHTMSTDPDCEITDGKETCAAQIEDAIVKKQQIYAGFTYFGGKNDIALIQLEESNSQSHDNVGPICLPFYTDTSVEYPSRMIVNGFGKTRTSAGSDVLMKVVVDARERSQCDHSINGRHRTLDHTQICAGNARNACDGDTGSSLHYPVKINNVPKNVQFGIVSYGFSDCNDNKPGVYTNVKPYLGWILHTMQDMQSA